MTGPIVTLMELRHLRYFIAVAEALSFTKAAKALRLAQPSLTRQVRNLEEELGVQLFDRANNRIALTEEGRQFFFDSKKLLAQCAASVLAAQKLQDGKNAHLNIGYISSIHYSLLPATLGAFRKVCPGVALNLFDMSSAEQLQGLDERRIDLGFVGLRPGLEYAQLQSRCMAQDDVLIVLPIFHKLQKKAKISLADFAQEFFISMSDAMQPGVREWLINECAMAGFQVKILQEADTEVSAIKFVADGLGVSLQLHQISGLPHDGVSFRPLTPPLRREAHMAWRGDNPSKALRDYIQIANDLSDGL